MRKLFFPLLSLLFIAYSSFSQKTPNQQLDHFFNQAYEKISKSSVTEPDKQIVKASSSFQSGAFQSITKFRDLKPVHPGRTRSGDTLFIGIPPIDSLTITGNYFHDGPIFVYGNGVLRFKNANATILGDLWVWGDKALVTADSSILNFPQQYFYQRSLIIAGNAKVIYRNTTLDHSGLSHNLLLTDSASMEMRNVKNIGFTTWGLYRKPEIFIDGINEAGEFVITDDAKLTFKNAKTILLWHHFPEKSIINFSFPGGDTITSYIFNKSTPGINGINYSINVQNSYNIMWGLMPENGTDITFSGSKIRAIGLWFTGNNSINVNGLVNNSQYSDFTTSLSDRKLRLINTSVQTWSLYGMDNSKLKVSGCILGEIGTQNRSQLETSQIFVDGSGGYWWSTDTTFIISGFSTAVNDIRSNKNSIFLFAYSTLASGLASAHENSILMLVQSNLPEEPVLFDKSCIWNAYIGKPSSSYVDTLVPIFGSAWIDKGTGSQLMDFAYFSMYYQKPADTTWYVIAEKVTSEKRDDVLVNFNTKGLKPGQYILKLLICDNTFDSNKVEAIKGINLMPKSLMEIDEPISQPIAKVFPDPFNDFLYVKLLDIKNDAYQITITDLYGRVMKEIESSEVTNEFLIRINSENWPKSVYFCNIRINDRYYIFKLIKNER